MIVFRNIRTQTSVPVLVAYVPLALILATPLSGLSLGGVAGDAFVMCTALFPAIDPLLIIYGIRLLEPLHAERTRHVLGLSGTARSSRDAWRVFCAALANERLPR